MKGGTAYQILLIAVFLAFWLWAAINPLFRHVWLLENYLVFIFVPIILVAGFYFRLSNLSYTLITIFMIMHVIGSHYTYQNVPFGELLKNWFNSDRNMYDRLVHFSFGFLLAYPVREVFMRISKTKGFWSFWFPLKLTLAFSAIYELIEWGAAITVDPAAGLAFLGAQGDVWDTQKDMAIAGLGALISMSIVFLVHLRYNKHFGEELKDSFKVPKDDKPLGEVALSKLVIRK